MVDNKLLTISEAASRLNRSVGWVRGLLKERKVSYVRLGKRKYIPEASLDGFYTVVHARKNTPIQKESQLSA